MSCVVALEVGLADGRVAEDAGFELLGGAFEHARRRRARRR